MPELERRQSPAGRRAFDEAQDATRRTRLANERTYLAWWRTGLTSLAVCVALGRVVPAASNVTAPAYQPVGACSGSVGIGFMLVAHVRVRMVERAVDRADFARLDERISFALLAIGVGL